MFLIANFAIFVFTNYLFVCHICVGGKIEKNEMGKACGAYGGGERGAQGVGGET
jgi:hypothetical protein